MNKYFEFLIISNLFKKNKTKPNDKKNILWMKLWGKNKWVKLKIILKKNNPSKPKKPVFLLSITIKFLSIMPYPIVETQINRDNEKKMSNINFNCIKFYSFDESD